MTDELVPSEEPEVTPGVATEARTAEQVEAEYKARLSGKDKAHAAEKAALERRVAEAEAKATTRSAAEEAARLSQMTDVERIAAERDALKQELEQTKREAVIETRTARFPAAAESLGGDVIAQMDEEKLSALNERLSGKPAAPRMDPNTAARTQGAEPERTQTSDELLAEMRKHSPAFEEQIRNPYGR